MDGKTRAAARQAVAFDQTYVKLVRQFPDLRKEPRSFGEGFALGWAQGTVASGPLLIAFALWLGPWWFALFGVAAIVIGAVGWRQFYLEVKRPRLTRDPAT